jgi:hypothetical protein
MIPIAIIAFRRLGEHHVDEAHQQRVELAAEEARGQPDRDPEDERDADRYKPDLQ